MSIWLSLFISYSVSIIFFIFCKRCCQCQRFRWRYLPDKIRWDTNFIGWRSLYFYLAISFYLLLCIYIFFIFCKICCQWKRSRWRPLQDKIRWDTNFIGRRSLYLFVPLTLLSRFRYLKILAINNVTTFISIHIVDTVVMS